MPVSRRQAIIAGAAVVLVAGGAVTWWWSASGPAPRPVPGTSASAQAPADPTPERTSPATSPSPVPEPEAGAEPAPAPGDAPSTAPGAQPPAGSDRARVDAVTTYAGWNDISGAVEVGAYVPVVESGGTCTLVLTGPGDEQRVQAPATPDVTSTACGALSVTGLVPGTWQAVVTYDSERSTGSSAPVTVEVP